MTDQRAASAHQPASDISKAQVLRFLQSNPDFLASTPAAWQHQNLGSGQDGASSVVDLSQFQLQRLRAQLQELQEQNRSYLQSGRLNTVILGKAERAVMRLLDAQSLEQVLATVGSELADVMGVDACVLALECERAQIGYLKGPGLYRLTPGSVQRVMGDKPVMLSETATFDALVFGKQAEQIASSCLVRLQVAEHGVAGILGFGARDVGAFDQGQGERIVSFLGHFVERVLGSWLLPREDLSARISA